MNDQEAIANIKQGGKQGVTELYHKYAQRLASTYRYQYGLTQHDSEDILHETFIQFVENIDKYDATRSSVYTYLSLIYKSRCFTFFDRDKRRHEIYQQAEQQQAVADDIKAEENALEQQACYHRCMSKAWQQFSAEFPDCAHALNLSTSGQYKEITALAEALGRTRGATDTFLSGCRKKLQKYWQVCKDECE